VTPRQAQAPRQAQTVEPETPPGQAPAAQPASATADSEPGAPQAAAATSSASGAGATGAADLRRLWPEVLVRLRELKRTPWSLISQESTVVDVSNGVLTLAFRKPNLRDTFARRADFQDYLRQAVKDVLGLDLRVDAIVDPSAGGGSQPAAQGDDPSSPASAVPSGRPSNPGRGTTAGSARPSRSEPDAAHEAGPGDRTPGGGDGSTAGRRTGRKQAGEPAPADDPQHDARPDDLDVDDGGLSERELLEQTLGAQVIEEIDHP